LSDLPKEEQRLVEGYRKGFYADFMMREETDRIRNEKTKASEHQDERRISQLDKTANYRGQVEALGLSQGFRKALIAGKSKGHAQKGFLLS